MEEGEKEENRWRVVNQVGSRRGRVAIGQEGNKAYHHRGKFV